MAGKEQVCLTSRYKALCVKEQTNPRWGARSLQRLSFRQAGAGLGLSARAPDHRIGHLTVSDRQSIHYCSYQSGTELICPLYQA